MLSITFTKQDQTFAFYMLPTRLWELAVGMGLFLGLNALDDRNMARVAQASPVVVDSLMFLSACGLFASLLLADETRFPFPWAVAPVFSAAALIGLVTLWPRAIIGRISF